jgi:hypothetical protein
MSSHGGVKAVYSLYGMGFVKAYCGGTGSSGLTIVIDRYVVVQLSYRWRWI